MIAKILKTKREKIMFKNLHHVSFSVSNIEISVEFYEKLGFELINKYDTDKKKMRVLSGYGFNIELFELQSELQDIDSNPNSCGIKHIALRADNIAEVYSNMEKLNINIKGEIKEAKSILAKYFFIIDPDGVLIEILEDL